jgi:hypothetical protein
MSRRTENSGFCCEHCQQMVHNVNRMADQTQQPDNFGLILKLVQQDSVS